MVEGQQIGAGTQFQVDCIRVEKVYDQCFSLEELPATVPVDIGRALLPTDVITCEMNVALCEVLEPLRDPDPEGFRTIDLVQFVTATVTVTDGAGVVVGETTDIQSPHFTSVTLYAPEGTFPACEIVDTFCEPVLIVDPGSDETAAQIRILKKLCKVVQVMAAVKLLIPTFGFCPVSPCEAFPQEFACPPDSPFPPQFPTCEQAEGEVTETLEGDQVQAAQTFPVAGANYRVNRRGRIFSGTTGANGRVILRDANGVPLDSFRPGDVVTVTLPVVLGLPARTYRLRPGERGCSLVFDYRVVLDPVTGARTLRAVRLILDGRVLREIP